MRTKFIIEVAVVWDHEDDEKPTKKAVKEQTERALRRWGMFETAKVRKVDKD